MLYSGTTRQDDDFTPLEDRNYGSDNDRQGLYVETPAALSRPGTFFTRNNISPPNSATHARDDARKCAYQGLA